MAGGYKNFKRSIAPASTGNNQLQNRNNEPIDKPNKRTKKSADEPPRWTAYLPHTPYESLVHSPLLAACRQYVREIKVILLIKLYFIIIDCFSTGIFMS